MVPEMIWSVLQNVARGGKRLETGFVQECHGWLGWQGEVVALGTLVLSRCQDRSLAYSFLPYLPTPNSNPRADVDNQNTFPDTWFMLSAPCIIIPRQNDPFVSGFQNYRERPTHNIYEITLSLLFQNPVWNSRLDTRRRQSVSVFYFVLSPI